MQMWINTIDIRSLQNGERITVDLNDKKNAILLFNLNGEFFAVENKCSHANLPLEDGWLENDQLICPFHGAQFCIKTGEVTAPPAFIGIKTFKTRIIDNIVQIEV